MRILADLIRFLCLSLRSRTTLAAENLFLRKQIASYQGRKVKPRRAGNPTRVTLVLIRAMAGENPSWGEQRIANELLMKLGLRGSPRTVRKYIPKLPGPLAGGPRGDRRRATFLENHARGIIACDFCVTVTATFRVLYVLLVMEHASRRLIQLSPTAA